MSSNAYVIVDDNPNPDGGTVCSLDAGRDPACEGPFICFSEPVGDWAKPNIVLCAKCAADIASRVLSEDVVEVKDANPIDDEDLLEAVEATSYDED